MPFSVIRAFLAGGMVDVWIRDKTRCPYVLDVKRWHHSEARGVRSICYKCLLCGIQHSDVVET